MVKPLKDLEQGKFNQQGNLKVSVEEDNTSSTSKPVRVTNDSSQSIPVTITNPDSGSDVDVTVKNTSSTPVPVEIVNTDTQVDLEVNIAESITIDSSTPVDVNLTNSSVNTNATIQNASLDVNLTDLDVNSRLPVSVDNQPTVTIDDATPVDVNVTNTVATNATIQNSEIDVNVTNAFQYVYDMVYDGAYWRFQLSDSSGRAINLDHTYYSSSEITALGSSTDINLWLAAYNDSMLQTKYVGTYNSEFEETVYYQHPSLGNGNKCLRLVYQYTTQNSQTVVESISASVADWNFTDEIEGSVTLTASAPFSPDPSSTITIGTTISTLTVVSNTLGDLTLSLSGVAASFYTLSDGTTTANSFTYDALKTYTIVTASDFSGADYSHSFSCTLTGVLFNVTSTVNFETSGTFVGAATFGNTEYVSNTYAGASSSTTYQYGRYYNVGTDGLWPSLENQTSFRDVTSGHTLSFYMKRPSTVSGLAAIYSESYNNSYQQQDSFSIYWSGNNTIYLYQAANSLRTYKTITMTNNSISVGDWFHFVLSCPANEGELVRSDVYINGSPAVTGSLQGNTTTNLIGSDFYIEAVNIGGTLPDRTSATGTYTGSNASSGTFDIDELTSWTKALSSTEVSELWNSGSGVLDPTTHSASSNLDRHLRFGDNSSDGINIYDDTDTNWYLTENTNTDNTQPLTSSDFIYVAASSSFSNTKYYKASTRTGIVTPDLILAGTNKNPFADNNIMPSLDDAFSMSFWLQVPSTASTFDPVIAFVGSDTRAHFKLFHLNGNFTASITSNSNAADYNFSHTTYNTWQHVVITKKAVIPRNPNYNNTDYFLQVYIDGVAKNPSVSYFDNNPGFASTSWDNLTVSEVIISGPARSYTTNGAYASNKSGRQWKVDELAFYNKELSQSEVTTIYNNGTTKDLMDLASSFNLSKYFRFGDHASDVDTTGSIECYDEVLDTVYFEDNDGTIENHTASDTPYVPASGSFANDYYITKATAASTTSKTGINSNASITNPLTSSWSISFWFKSNSDLSGTNITDGNPSNDIVLITTETIASDSSYYKGFTLGVRSQQLRINFTDSGSIYYINGTSNITDTLFNGSWHNVIVTHSGTSNSSSTWASNCKVYIDNGTALSSAGAAANGTPSTSSTTPYFGKGTSSFTHVTGMSANYDEMAVWTTTELDSTARTAIYNSGSPTDLENTTGVATPTVYYRGEDSTDLGYETISASNTTNETDVQQIAY